MDWKRVLTGFAFACFGALGLMSSMPMLLSICDPASAWCPKEPNILVYFLVVVSLLLLITGMGLLLRAGNASYRETHPKPEKPVKQSKPEMVNAEKIPARTSPTAFDREAVLADMKAPPVFGNARRRPLQPALDRDASERVFSASPFEPARPEPLVPAAPPNPPVPPSSFAGNFDAHMASSPMAPRLARKTSADE